MSLFDHLEPVPPSSISKVVRKYIADSSKNKVDLASGEYKNADGNPWVLPSVKRAAQEIHQEEPIIAEYVFPNMFSFPHLAAKALLGENNLALEDDRVHVVQTMSGTGGLRLGAEFLVSFLGSSIYYYSNPTWDNHLLVFDRAGFKEGRSYRYWCPTEHVVDFTGMIEDLSNAPEGSVIILHACAHNPTGIDLSKEQWKQVAAVMKRRKLFPFFDSAFQGLAEGLEQDAWAVRYFIEKGFELFCSQSFSKNMGLYSERIGSLVIVTKNSHAKKLIEGNLAPIHRAMYLIPSAPGNRIVTRMLSKPELTEQWYGELELMRKRIAHARHQLLTSLELLGTPGDWSFITKQVGISTLTGLNDKQVEYIANKHHVYLRTGGRANLSAITTTNVGYIANAIHETVTSLYS